MIEQDSLPPSNPETLKQEKNEEENPSIALEVMGEKKRDRDDTEVASTPMSEKDNFLKVAHEKGAEAFVAIDPTQAKERFNVAVLAEKFPQSREEIIQILQEKDDKSRPKQAPRGLFDFLPPRVEFVQLDKVAGGPYRTDPPTWLVDIPGQERENRGAVRILELVKKFQAGEGFDPNSPIRVEKYGDEYYIGADGRHRMGALKAMGVSELPMIVLEAKPQEETE